MTDPSPDCGYTEEELAQMDAVDANPGPNCVTAWKPDEQENGAVISPLHAQSVFVKISFALRGSGYLVGWFGSTATGHDGNDIDVMIVQADRLASDPIVALRLVADDEPIRLAPDPRVTFESWRLSVDGNRVDVHLHRIGEYCSGAAQDAWDRIEVLEKALREADRLASVAHDAIWSKEVASASILYDNDREDSAQSAIWRLHEVIRPLLPAGSATPGGDET